MSTDFPAPDQEGSRDELVRRLREQAVGWRHFGNERLAQESTEAADELESGEDWARAGATKYKVT